MKITNDVRLANSASVVACDMKRCDCGNIYVRLHDANDLVFAGAVMDRETAREFAADLLDEVEKVEEASAAVGAVECRQH